jgi:Family of unknown function (DUF6328)
LPDRGVMDIGKPVGTGKWEEVRLEAAASYLLEECRMILPGIQALFGFQLIAVFNQGFDEKLTSGEQQLHFFALFLVALAAALGMSLDVYLIARAVFGTPGIGLVLSAVLLALLIMLWMVLPRLEGSRNR